MRWKGTRGVWVVVLTIYGWICISRLTETPQVKKYKPSPPHPRWIYDSIHLSNPQPIFPKRKIEFKSPTISNIYNYPSPLYYYAKKSHPSIHKYKHKPGVNPVAILKNVHVRLHMLLQRLQEWRLLFLKLKTFLPRYVFLSLFVSVSEGILDSVW